MADTSTMSFQKTCKICGKHFSVNWARRKACYCSDSCRKAGVRVLRKRYYKLCRRPAPPREIVCKKCGNVFMGKSMQGYCQTCIHDGSAYMNKLLNNRTIREDEYEFEQQTAASQYE